MGKRAAGVAVVIAVVGYAWVAGTTDSFTWPALIVTAVAVLGVVLLAVRPAGGRSPVDVAMPPAGVGAWAALTVVTVGWQLAAYFRSPRADHPTISSMLDAADTSTFLRAAVFLGWMLLGVVLARR